VFVSLVVKNVVTIGCVAKNGNIPILEIVMQNDMLRSFPVQIASGCKFGL
jgi:hypothetical protein